MPEQQPRDVRKVPKSAAHVNRKVTSSENPAVPPAPEQPLDLLAIARENPYWQFEIADLSRMTNHSVYVLQQLNKEPKSPIISGKSRPEWIVAWLRDNPGWVPRNAG